ncbi:hypothetical protein AYI68_g966 [Smittium mucronatum]|uniref:Uncharacterized protein n=1 Tax=Smittium mucronatum TaxID=133383 RepID=A0A1R0H6Z6_9FUNG|nr:hypothetical protein AYI68_g966 [Smittium mucronatum]
MSSADTPAEESRVAPIARAFGIRVFGGRPIRPDDVSYQDQKLSLYRLSDDCPMLEGIRHPVSDLGYYWSDVD